jgi:hypothetical protein
MAQNEVSRSGDDKEQEAVNARSRHHASRGTAIAVHSNVDALLVLPREWATWGARRVAPQMIIQRIAKDLVDPHCTARIRRDGRAVGDVGSEICRRVSQGIKKG